MSLTNFKNADLTINNINTTYIPKQYASEGDYLGRALTVQITDDGLIGRVDGAQLVLHWKNIASGLSDDSAFTLVDAENAIFRIEYPQNMLTPGTVKANILVIYQGKTTVSREFEITVANVAGQSTGVLAKAEFSALVAALSEANGISSRLIALETSKADKSYVDALIASVTSGGPKELFYSIQALKNKYPNGEIGTFLVLDASLGDGSHSFIWSNGMWKDLGLYQSQAIDDGVITLSKMDKINRSNVTKRAKISNIGDTFARGQFQKDGTIIDTPAWGYVIIPVKKGETLSYKVNNDTQNTASVYAILFDEDMNYLASSLSNINNSLAVSQNGFAVINNYRFMRSDSMGLDKIEISSYVGESIIDTGAQILSNDDMLISGYYEAWASAAPTIKSHSFLKTTQWVPVKESGLYMVSGRFNPAFGLIGTDSNKTKAFGLVVSCTKETSSQNIVFKIPKDVAYIAYSSDPTYQFSVIDLSTTRFANLLAIGTNYDGAIDSLTDAITTKRLSNIAKNALLDSVQLSDYSNTFSAGVMRETGEVYGTDKWNYTIIPIKKNQSLEYKLANDITTSEAYALLFDKNFNYVARSNKNINTLVATVDGFAVFNTNTENKEGTIQNTDVYIKGVASGSIISTDYVIANNDDLVVDGYYNIHTRTIIDYPLTVKSPYKSTDFIPVKEGGLYLYTGYLGTAHGIIGYTSDNRTLKIVLLNSAKNTYNRNTIVKIPDGVHKIKISANPNLKMELIDLDTDSFSDLYSQKSFDESVLLDLPNTTKNNFPESGSPLDYKYYRQWGRRDFYNDVDSFGIFEYDVTTNPFRAKSNIFPKNGDAFEISTKAGRIEFGNPKNNGMSAIQIKNYFPFLTDRLLISEISGNANMGIFFGDSDFKNGLRVYTNGTSYTADLLIDGTVSKTQTYAGASSVGKYMQIQNTGRALIIMVFEKDLSDFKFIGRFDFGLQFDARKESLTDTWKTHIFALTNSFSSEDKVSFELYNSAIRSGSNSVSIRFLKYENGEFIQRGNKMYFLVEGTGATISDLFTQLVEIDFKSMQVQSIGAIFQVRSDGTDDGVLLGDDSITMIFDRNSQSWKGISCGMEYYDYMSNTANRPKLYFETTQDILHGGIIIVRNSQAVKMTDGTNAGTSANAYTEDYDFYYDGLNWIVTGNSVSGGFVIYQTPDLKNNYEVIKTITNTTEGVRDTGNQFVKFGDTRFIMTGGTSNKLGVRDFDGNYLGELDQDVKLDSATNGPWATIVPYKDGDKTTIFLMSFDRDDFIGSYDHGGLYCWKAVDK